MDQLRYNDDKPCSTYFYANHLALARFETSFSLGLLTPNADSIVTSASTFLAQAWADPWAPLVRVVTSLLAHV